LADERFREEHRDATIHHHDMALASV
jgi:hypothetical protein